MIRRRILLDKQNRINSLLKTINPDYEIAFLRKGAKGHYQFALKGEFSPDDLGTVRDAFRNVLRGLREREKKVQTKVYLPESIHEQLRKLAFDTHKSLSDIVAEGIQAYSRQR